MTARQPRRRRRAVAAAPLPRPVVGEAAFEAEPESAAATGPSLAARRAGPRRPQMREHHVTTDYGYVHRDLLAIGAIGAVCVAFIVAMSFVVG